MEVGTTLVAIKKKKKMQKKRADRFEVLDITLKYITCSCARYRR